jgi:hypothetical protein
MSRRSSGTRQQLAPVTPSFLLTTLGHAGTVHIDLIVRIAALTSRGDPFATYSFGREPLDGFCHDLVNRALRGADGADRSLRLIPIP